MQLTALALVLGLLAPADDAAKRESAKLDGEWAMVSGEADGTAMPPAMAATGRRVAKGGETTISFGGRVFFKAKFTVDPTKSPKAIDYDMTEGPTAGQKQLGIYELDGDTVKFCFAAPGKDRPTDFTSKPGSGRTLSVWKREGNPVVATVKAAVGDPAKPFTLVVKIKVKDGEGAKFEAAFAKAAAASRREPGNRAYELNRSAKSPNEYLLYERWQNVAALESHVKSEHFAEVMAAIRGMLDGTADISVYLALGERGQ